MSQEIVKMNVNTISMKYSSDVKEELQNEYYSDNKVCVSVTTITDTVNITNTELNEDIKNDKTWKYDTLSVDHMKTDLPSEVNNRVSDVKIEDAICPVDVEIKFCNELLVCSHCHEVYQDYCTKCRVLVHILNNRPCRNRYNRIRELPKCMLETRESIGELGIFSLKVIPEDVRFGPFTGLNSTELPLRIKGGKFVVGNEKSEHLNWMQYINPARNNYEQNLLPIQYEDKLYYCSTRRIQEGEELLVYFGKEYDDNILKNMEMDFIPIAEKDVENVFACIFCCLGFRSKEYLAEHKAVCHSVVNEMFSVEELAQCPFCKIYFEGKEYFEHHKDYCSGANVRYHALSSPASHELEVERRSSETHEAQRHQKHHTNKHYEEKMYKCGNCHRKYKTKESLKAHMSKNHVNDDGRGVQTYTTCDYFKVNTKNIKERSPHSHDEEKQCQCTKCNFQTRDKCHLKSLIKTTHLNRGRYKCAICEFQTYYRSYLERHIKVKHAIKSNYKCMECEFKTNYKSVLKVHIEAKHLNQKDCKCTECEYKTNYKSDLERHIKAKHLKQDDYKCVECEYKTNFESYLIKHMKAKHIKTKLL